MLSFPGLRAGREPGENMHEWHRGGGIFVDVSDRFGLRFCRSGAILPLFDFLDSLRFANEV